MGALYANWGDARISADLICYMNGYDDPRREVYYNKSTFATESGNTYKGAEDYVGLRRGIRQGQFNSWSHGYSCMKVTVSDKMLIFPASEVTFLRQKVLSAGGIWVEQRKLCTKKLWLFLLRNVGYQVRALI